MSDRPDQYKPPAPPKHLQVSGRAFWRGVTKQYQLRPDELRLLDEAAATVDIIDALDVALTGAPLLTEGTKGQARAHPLLAEIRAQRVVLAQLLRLLALPEPDDARGAVQAGNRSTSARAAAQARWAKRS